MHHAALADIVSGRIDFCKAFSSSDSRDDASRPAIEQGQVCVVGGWILGAVTAQRVEIVADGRTIGLAEKGLIREDVAHAFQMPGAERCGVNALIATADLSVGDHLLTLEMVDSSGQRLGIDGDPLVISIGEPQSLAMERAWGNVDEVRINDVSVTSDDRCYDVAPGDVVVVRGWIIDARSCRPGAVAALIVDGEAAVAMYGMRRDDVAKMHGEGALWCGFVGSISISEPSSADVMVTVGLVANDGTWFDRLENMSIRLQQKPGPKKESQ